MSQRAGKYAVLQSLLAAATLSSAVVGSAQNQVPPARLRNTPPNPGADASARPAPRNSPRADEVEPSAEARTFFEKAADVIDRTTARAHAALGPSHQPLLKETVQPALKELSDAREKLDTFAAKEGFRISPEANTEASAPTRATLPAEGDAVVGLLRGYRELEELLRPASRSSDTSVAAFANELLRVVDSRMASLETFRRE